MKFKYSEYIGPNGTKIFRPTVPIIFKNRSKFIQTEAIIDSGSDFTMRNHNQGYYWDIKDFLKNSELSWMEKEEKWK